MCQFFPVEIAAICGRPLRVYPWKKPLLERTHTRREPWCQKWVKNTPCRTTFLRLCRIFSGSFFSPRAPMVVSQKRQKLRSKKVNPDRDFRGFPYRKPTEISLCVDFFRPTSFPYRVHIRCPIGAKDPIRIRLTHAEKNSD